jgi:predicted glycosyltransferase
MKQRAPQTGTASAARGASEPESRRKTAGSEHAGPRIALFTHDTYGLGHVRRCKHLLRAISRRSPEAAILLITGSPTLGDPGDLPANADFLKIPTIVKTGASERRPPHLPIGPKAVTSLRKRLVRSAVDSFKPDLFLVDNFPLGSRKELRPTLEHLRKNAVPTVLGLRDIVDRPDVVRAAWEKDGIYEALQSLYDCILVYGTREILDVTEAYALPPEVSAKVHYCGYVTSTAPPSRDPETLRTELGLERPIVLATVGGGGDGFPLLSCFVRAVRRTSHVSAVAVTGPLMAPADRRRVRDLAGGESRIVVKDSVTDLASYLASADLVVAMGGYNTIAELLARRRSALVVPRDWRYGEYDRGVRAGREWEQLMRAQALERLGLLRVLSLQTLTPDSLAAKISDALHHGSRVAGPRIDVSGVERAADRILSLIQSRADRAPA